MSTAVATAPKVSSAQEINAPKEGVVVATLFDVDPTWIENYRSEIGDDDLQQLYGSIEEASKKPMIGIKQTVLGTWNQGLTKILLVAGFCRYLCAYLYALRPLIKKYNEHFGYKNGDPGWLPYNGTDTSKENRNARRSPTERWKAIRTIRDQGGEWAEQFDNALKSWKLQINLRDYGDPETAEAKALAMIDNVDENENRTDPSLWDKLSRIDSLVNAGAKAKKIADVMGLTEGQVSAYRKISSVPDMLRERFSSAEVEAAFPDVKERQKEQGMIEVAIAEYLRRLREPKDSPETISVSHAKDFAFVINNKNKPINVKELSRLTRRLVALSEAGTPTTKATPDLTVFRSFIEQAIKATKLPDEPTAPQTGAEMLAASVEGGGGTTAKAGHGDGPTPEDLAIQQASEKAAVAAAATIKQQQADAASGDAAKEAELKAANATAPPLVAPLTSVPPIKELKAGDEAGLVSQEELEDEIGFDEMVSGVAVPGDLAAAAAQTKPADPTGQTRTKTKDADLSKYTRIADEKVEHSANAYLKDSATEATATIVDIAGYLLAATEDFFMLGMQPQYNVCNKLHVEYSTKANDYLKNLEDFLEKKATAEEKELIRSLKPVYAPPSLV